MLLFISIIGVTVLYLKGVTKAKENRLRRPDCSEEMMNDESLRVLLIQELHEFVDYVQCLTGTQVVNI
jgi:hypothetical protein